MTSDELQQVIDGLDRVRSYVYADDELLRAVRIASDILVRFPDEALEAYDASAAARERQEAAA
jgi:hypothetical protein